MDRNPPITNRKRDFLPILREASLFRETYTMTFVAVKHQTVCGVLSFTVHLLLKSAVKEKKGRL